MSYLLCMTHWKLATDCLNLWLTPIYKFVAVAGKSVANFPWVCLHTNLSFFVPWCTPCTFSFAQCSWQCCAQNSSSPLLSFLPNPRPNLTNFKSSLIPRSPSHTFHAQSHANPRKAPGLGGRGFTLTGALLCVHSQAWRKWMFDCAGVTTV